MKNRFNKIFSLTVLISGFAMAQRPTPAPKQTVPIAITGATIHTGTGDEHIDVGNEDDGEGLEASAKGFWSEMD